MAGHCDGSNTHRSATATFPQSVGSNRAGLTSLGVLWAAHKKIHCSVAVICVQVSGWHSLCRSQDKHYRTFLKHQLGFLFIVDESWGTWGHQEQLMSLKWSHHNVPWTNPPSRRTFEIHAQTCLSKSRPQDTKRSPESLECLHMIYSSWTVETECHGTKPLLTNKPWRSNWEHEQQTGLTEKCSSNRWV